MAEETAIMIGLGIITFILFFGAFEFSRSDNKSGKIISLALILFSFVFLVIDMLTIYLIAINQAPYLKDSVLFSALQVMLVMIGLFVFAIVLSILYYILKQLYVLANGVFGRKKQDGGSNG